ncbi:uncharacterized protein LOC116338105 [Contarinia nasturtii]|uniref:uncharacterized protein LOC116338105 n=1 Tax=Contarinia nasturtii TaxID=265458 RepID=UPI0012D408E0|nr:uncharacterized protein LOC116338105 [Contarinia nasturtii]
MLNQKLLNLLFFGIYVLVTVESAHRKYKNSVESAKDEDSIIWHRFNAKDIDNKTIIDYQIRNIPKSLYKKAVNFMVEHYMRDEPISKEMGIINNRTVVKQYREDWLSNLSEGVSVACFKGDTNIIVGVQILNIVTDKTMTICGFDVFSEYDVDIYIDDEGMAVDSAYRGRKIGRELLVARKSICAFYGIRVTSSVFSSMYSISMAIDVGFEFNKHIQYDDIQLYIPEILPYFNCTEIILMSKKYN